MNLPLPQLRKLAKAAGVFPDEGTTKWDYATALAQLPREQLEQLAGEWMYAGQTSITWVFLSSDGTDGAARLADGPAGTPIDFEDLKAALTAQCGADPFEADVRPEEVTGEPKLVEATVLEEHKIGLLFVVARRVAKVIHNFEVQDVYQDEFFQAIIRLDAGVVEIRANHDRARVFIQTWLAELADRL